MRTPKALSQLEWPGWGACFLDAEEAEEAGQLAPSYPSQNTPTPSDLDGQVEAPQLVARQRVGAAAHDNSPRLIQLHDLFQREW